MCWMRKIDTSLKRFCMPFVFCAACWALDKMSTCNSFVAKNGSPVLILSDQLCKILQRVAKQSVTTWLCTFTAFLFIHSLCACTRICVDGKKKTTQKYLRTVSLGIKKIIVTCTVWNMTNNWMYRTWIVTAGMQLDFWALNDCIRVAFSTV